MKNFYYQLLQQLNAKKSEKGFTLIELLVVIIIIGILSAIALPAFLNQANKARQSEAKQALGSINRGQQAYYLERQGFATRIDRLGLGVASFTQNYNYGSGLATNFDGENSVADNTGLTDGGPGDNDARGWDSYSLSVASASNQAAVRDYFGIAFLVPASNDLESTTRAILCEEDNLTAGSDDVVIADPTAPIFTATTNCLANPVVTQDVLDVAQ